jgi:hypothetical protein
VLLGHAGGAAPVFDLSVSDGLALTGPYPANIVFMGGTIPPANGGTGDALAIAGDGAYFLSPPATQPATGLTPVLAATLPSLLSGLPGAIATEFLRTPVIGPIGLVLQAGGGLQETKFAMAAGLAPIRAEGDVIDTRLADVQLGVAPLRAEMSAVPTEKADMSVNVDPLRAEMGIVPTHLDLALADAEKWRLETIASALKVGGLLVALGATWWAVRSTGLISGLLAAAPTWRHVDPLPALGRDDEDEAKQGPEGAKQAGQDPTGPKI